MSSERSVPAVDLSLAAAPVVSVIVGTAHAAAVLALAMAGLPAWLRVAAGAGIAGNGLLWILKSGLRILPGSVRRVLIEPDGEVVLVDGRGRTRYGTLAFGSVIGASLVILSIRCRRATTTAVPVAAEAADRETFRRLRVRVQLAPPATAPLRTRALRTVSRWPGKLLVRESARSES